MAAYTLTAYETSSKLTYKDKAKYKSTTNGSFRGVVIGNLQVELNLFHIVQLTTKDSFMAFYETNKALLVDVTYDGVVYPLYFSKKPLLIALGSDMWKISAKLSGLA